MIFDKRFKEKYGFICLLVSLVSLLIVPPYMSVGLKYIVTIIALTTVMLSFLLLVATTKLEIGFGAFLAIPVLILNWGGHTAIDGSVFFYLTLLNIFFYLYIVYELVKFILLNKRVDFNLIAAAISVYFLLGLIWAYIYVSIESQQPGAILAIDIVSAQVDIFSELFYFSFVTMTTLGYGDIAPQSVIAQRWVVLQSIFGQFYMAIMIARLMSIYSVSSSDSVRE